MKKQEISNLKDMYIASDISYTDMKDYQFFNDVILNNVFGKGSYISMTEEEKVQKYLIYKNSPKYMNENNQLIVKLNSSIVITYKDGSGKTNLEYITNLNKKTAQEKEAIAKKYNLNSLKQSLREFDIIEYLNNNKLVNFVSPDIFNSNNSNIQAMSFYNEKTKNMDTVFRGTTNKTNDYLTDIKMGIGITVPQYFDEAEEFALSSYKNNSKEIKNINYYGHSLGGTMANYSAQKMTKKLKGLEETKCSSTTLNAYNAIRFFNNKLDEMEADCTNYIHSNELGIKEVLTDLGEAEIGSIHKNVELKSLNKNFEYFDGHKMDGIDYTIRIYEEIFKIIGEESIEKVNETMKHIDVPSLSLLVAMKRQGIKFEELENLNYDVYEKIQNQSFKENIKEFLNIDIQEHKKDSPLNILKKKSLEYVVKIIKNGFVRPASVINYTKNKLFK